MNDALDIPLLAGTDTETCQLIRRSMEGASAARDEQWTERIKAIVELSVQGVADALHAP